MSKDSIILQVENLEKIYGKENSNTMVKALDNINLIITEGEFIIIIGSSGSGKSTLLHILGGVDKPTSGKVIIKNKNIYELDEDKQAIFRRQEVGLIYQFYNLIPILNVKENISLPILLDGKKVDEAHLNELIKLLDLEDRVKHLPSELSGGQQQRVAIGRALINHPCLILADEPTGNLDSKNSKEIMDLLKKANESYKQTIIMVTHNGDLIEYANRVITIEDGKIISDKQVKK